MLVPDELWPLVPTFLDSFVIGRLLFGVGYFIPAMPESWALAPLGTLNGWLRSPGMNLTLYPCNFTICACFYFLYFSEKAGGAGHDEL